ncbi:putative alpha glucosidase II subunit [Leptomonas pyrrhocoris]|uniref:Glucosidase II subunit alpha n=1 Tax=Leptomonas pyrrhocoris TaxID=157538 RepID=A0A0M9FYB6_LEPPY|nr:putative alpha glucosidase II subunit [Leptomonas pyrrhocoris]XP_015656877.1 putative alpha glucosidase II subunit [Leptomonas pyrrhocoris]KPA78437.1 putative alpha glucosidase II subunit [Leptomonas pyrrhocoris]KPA78438.1 putative alpha glucosidase II subunit [Leptomonas pyrrhocoris]|eukprot:XP_015656876.1 putative alpha glucosidase II subunit [Leptomonas pyrrhocoris]
MFSTAGRCGALLAVVALMLVATVTPVALGTRVTTTKSGMGVDGFAYPKGIIRLTVKSTEKWQYQPDGIILPAASELQVEAAKEGNKWTLHNGDCALTVTSASPQLSFQFSCQGKPLVKATASDNVEALPEVNFTFPAARTMYGLAEHAADLPLRGDAVYEMYNTDAFQYPINSTKALYGAIPFIMAYSAAATSGVLFLNPSETSVRINSEDAAPSCRWQPEVGVVDLFFLPGPTPAKVQRQHASLTGATVMPPYFSLGYHQCRWNYMNTKDCLSVDEGFDQHNMPYDVLWLDIEHTDKKKYFTWDKYTFPDPKVLTTALASKGRKLVTVKDPHVKREGGFAMHEEASKGGYYVKDANGNDYEGECWPGRSSWPDFLNTRTRNWYAEFFHDDRYPGGGRDIHTWVDMNEPSIFNGDKGTMFKNAMHTLDDGHTVSHGTIHNAYSFYSIQAVYKGMVEAGGAKATPERPFILTRSFFPGSQRYAAMWTGDNMARWDHLENSVPELLSLSISNFPFCGCDVGGFFFDTEEELFVRWMQAGAFMPFFRGHAHLDTKRREPWSYSPASQPIIRNALALRYALIPYLYTNFYHAHTKGNTIMRPLFFEFPEQEKLREVQNTYLFGRAILVQPVAQKGATEVTVPLPAGTLWYNYFTGEMATGGTYTMPVDLNTIPMFLRGGHVVPMKLRLRRSTYAARLDPFTLFVALNAQGNSYGDLYCDDGTTFEYAKGSFVHRTFSFSESTLTSSSFTTDTPASNGVFAVANAVERVVVYGYSGKVSKVVLTTAHNAIDMATELDFEQVGATVIVRQPKVLVAADWFIAFENE